MATLPTSSSDCIIFLMRACSTALLLAPPLPDAIASLPLLPLEPLPLPLLYVRPAEGRLQSRRGCTAPGARHPQAGTLLCRKPRASS